MWLLLINPTSGGGRGAKVGAEVARYLVSNSIQYSDISGSSFESARTNLRESLSTTVNGVIAVGGDGMVHLVIQELAEKKVPLLLIPAGTGNDFARVLHLPLDNPTMVLEKALSSAPTHVDLGRVNGTFFAEVLSTGFDSIVNERANRMVRITGKSKYYISMLLELPLFKPKSYKFRMDGSDFECKAMLIAVGNGSSYGGGMKVCPTANMSDGEFEVMILHEVSTLEFLRVFPSVFSGAHVKHPAVKILRGKEIEISADAVAYADGERIGSLPIRAHVVPSALLTWAY